MAFHLGVYSKFRSSPLVFEIFALGIFKYRRKGLMLGKHRFNSWQLLLSGKSKSILKSLKGTVLMETGQSWNEMNPKVRF